VINVTLEPANPYDYNREELQHLGAELSRQNHEIEVTINLRPERGYGVTYIEVLNITASSLGILSALLAIVVPWARDRWRKDRADHPGQDPRPRVLRLYGPDGRVAKLILIDGPDGEAQEEEPENGQE
jgi:hypothetical protein